MILNEKESRIVGRSPTVLDMVIIGDALEELKKMDSDSVHCVVTSPPYWGLRDYGHEGQIGLEKSPADYVESIANVFSEIHRVLRKDGTVWLNLGDSYVGGGRNAGNSKPHPKGYKGLEYLGNMVKTENFGLPSKNLVGIPWRVAFRLQELGWYLRSDIIWHKPNPKPESVRDRPTKAHEYLFLLTRADDYYYDADVIMEPSVTNEDRPHGVIRDRIYGYDSKAKKIRESVKRGVFNGKTNVLKGREAFRAVQRFRNKRSVWMIPTKPYKGAHFAVFPEALVEPCIKAGSPKGGIVLDPFCGSGTTLAVAKRLGRQWVGIELNRAYLPLIKKRLESTPQKLHI